MKQHEKELPMLAGIAGFFRWIEELLNILNGPILMVGAGIALVSLLSDGALTATLPALIYVWAISQALGIDTQLLGCFARARIALRERHGWAIAGWLVLGLILGYAAWQAGYVFAVQQSQHVTEAEALTQLNMSPVVWLAWRAFLAVGLVALSGWTRYAAPLLDAHKNAQEERARLEADLTLEQLRAQKRAIQLRGARGAWNALKGREEVPPANSTGGTIAPSQLTPVTSETPEEVPPDRGPTGPGSPVRKRGVRNTRKRGGKVVALRNPSVEERAAAAWVSGMSIPALEKAAGISRPSAQKYHAKFSAQAAQQSDQAAQ